jgi:hypothetical protein
MYYLIAQSFCIEKNANQDVNFAADFFNLPFNHKSFWGVICIIIVAMIICNCIAFLVKEISDMINIIKVYKKYKIKSSDDYLKILYANQFANEILDHVLIKSQFDLYRNELNISLKTIINNEAQILHKIYYLQMRYSNLLVYFIIFLLRNISIFITLLLLIIKLIQMKYPIQNCIFNECIKLNNLYLRLNYFDVQIDLSNIFGKFEMYLIVYWFIYCTLLIYHLNDIYKFYKPLQYQLYQAMETSEKYGARSFRTNNIDNDITKICIKNQLSNIIKNAKIDNAIKDNLIKTMHSKIDKHIYHIKSIKENLKSIVNLQSIITLHRIDSQLSQLITQINASNSYNDLNAIDISVNPDLKLLFKSIINQNNEHIKYHKYISSFYPILQTSIYDMLFYLIFEVSLLVFFLFLYIVKFLQIKSGPIGFLATIILQIWHLNIKIWSWFLSFAHTKPTSN